MASKTKSVQSVQRVSKSISQIKALLKHQFKQVILHGSSKHGLLYFIEGVPGIGKTAIMSQICKEISEELKNEFGKSLPKNNPNYEFFKTEQKGQVLFQEINLSAKAAQDFTGLPILEKTKEMTLQKFAHPDTIPTQGYGMVFYDESNRVIDTEMKSTLLSLWMSRGVNNHYLGEGYIQVTAGNNFDDDRFEDVGTPDLALKERYRIIRMKPTFKEVVEYLEKAHGKHFLIDFLKENTDLCNVASEDYDSSYSPRTLDKTMDATYAFREECESQEDQELLRDILDTYLSSVDAKKIMDFYINQRKDISFEQIVANPKLLSRLLKNDMPATSKITNEIYEKVTENFKKKKSFSANEKVAIVKIANKLNVEVLSQNFWEKIARSTNAQEFVDFLVTEIPEFIKNQSGIVEELFSETT